MALVATIVAIPTTPTNNAFGSLSGRGLRIDNQEMEIAVINNDASQSVTITALKLKRIYKYVFFDWDGNVLTPTVNGVNTNILTVTLLPANVKGITVLLSGSKR